MKHRILPFSFLLITSVSFGQKVQDDFWGIPFGSSMEKVKQLMETKPGCRLTQYSPHLAWLYEGCRFGGYNAETIILSFSSNQFYNATVTLQPNSRSDDRALNKQFVHRDFNDIYNSVKTKYGREATSYGEELMGPKYIWRLPTGCTNCELEIELAALTWQITLEYTSLKSRKNTAKNPKSDF